MRCRATCSPLSDQFRRFRAIVLKHIERGWDMMIAFPPCTYLAESEEREGGKGTGARTVGVAYGLPYCSAHCSHTTSVVRFTP